MTEIYCVRCKDKKEIKNPEPVTFKNGGHALKGKCPVCKTTVHKFVAGKK